jgi:hypothetical protein
MSIKVIDGQTASREIPGDIDAPASVATSQAYSFGKRILPSADRPSAGSVFSNTRGCTGAVLFACPVRYRILFD